jgi:hypothetical protein
LAVYPGYVVLEVCTPRLYLTLGLELESRGVLFMFL